MMNIIYDGVKAGSLEGQIEPFEALIQEIVHLGAEAIIGGCTEILLLAQHIKPLIPFFNPGSNIVPDHVMSSVTTDNNYHINTKHEKTIDFK